MKEPVDKLLTGRIRQVFEDFEDSSADAGWKALRKKYPERNRRPLILWLSSAAALLILAAGLWFIQQPEQLVALKPAEKEKTIEKAEESKPVSPKIARATETGRKPISGLPESRRSVDQGLVVAGNQRSQNTSTPDKGTTTIAAREEAKPAVSEIIPDQETGERAADQPLAAISKQTLPEISTPEEKTGNTAVVNKPVVKLPTTPLAALKPLQTKTPSIREQVSTAIPNDPVKKSVIPGDVKLPETILSAQAPKDKKPLQAPTPSIKEPVAAAVPKDPSKESVIAKEFNPRPVDGITKDDPAKSKKQKLGFSVYAGSYFNYSEGSENQLNFGAGFMSDIRLSKNLKLSTGVSIASNSLDYSKGQDVPANAASSFLSMGDYSTTGNLTTITSYQASLLALDIPVNIKYQFVPESDKFYVSAGLSSGTYLNETYLYEYRNFNTASGNYVSQTEDQKTKKQLNDFDLGRTLNLSMGISTGFGKTQMISIEPFLKYPLGGLGSENLRFGSTGINLKLRFNP